MLSREEIAKFVYKDAENLTHKQLIEFLINECFDNQQLSARIEKQEQIIETQRRRIKKLLEKKGEQQ